MADNRKIGFDVAEHLRPIGWKWDEMIWTKEHERHQAVIPTLFDPDISLIKEELWRSGIGDGQDLKIIRVVEDPHSGAPWRPVVRPGFYYIAHEQFYLFGPNSVIAFGGLQTDTDFPALSKVDLIFPPKPGAHIRVAFMHRRSDGNVRDIDNFRHRVRFTGKTVTETDQYGDLVSRTEAIDLDLEGNVVDYNIANLPVSPEQRPLEYTVIQRPEAWKKEHITSNHPAGQGTSSIETIVLENVPVFGPAIAFSNQNLFNDYVHNTVPTAVGEFTIDYVLGEVHVMTGTEDQVPGFITYWSDFPATLLFNDYYVRQMGFDWPIGGGAPPFNLVTQGDFLGISRMLPNQAFYLSYFPLLDRDELRVFVYDPRNEEVEEWLRVDDLEAVGPTDKVFVVSPDGGFILFGDGIRGRIPHRYAYISANYKYVPFIEYVPDDVFLHVKPDTVNLQPLANSVHRGFVFLGHKEPSVDQLVLVTNRSRVPDRPETYGPIDAGNDFALLTCTAFTAEGDVVPEQELVWTLDPHLGFINGVDPFFSPVRTITDNAGRSRVVYTPIRSSGDMGVIVNLFEGDGSPTENQLTTVLPEDTLLLSENIEGNLDAVFVFMVLNDDPLLPYDPLLREGGRYVILYRWSGGIFTGEDEFDWVVVQPDSIVSLNRLVFDQSLPTPADIPSLVQYAVLMDRIVTVRASTINRITGVRIVSNPIDLLIRIPDAQRGVYTVGQIEPPHGSTLDSATYLTISRDGTNRFIVLDPRSTTSTTSTTTTSSTSSTTTSTTP